MTATLNTIPRIRAINPFRLAGEFRESPLEFLTAYKPVYGDTYKARIISRDITITSDPEWMRYILQTHQKDFGRGFAYQILKMALGNGLLVNEGESWLRQRRLAQPAFYKKRLEDLFHLMEEKANAMVAELDAQRGGEIDVTDVFWKVTSNIVIATLLGGKGPQENAFLQDAILQLQEYLVSRIRHPLATPLLYLNGRHRRFKKILAEFDKGIYGIIEEKRRSGERGNDLLSMLMDAEDEETGEKMSDEQLRDEFITIYVAGHETSSYALSWTMYLLSTHPEVCRKVKAEAASIENIDEIGYEGLRSLEYINMVLLESMRLYPPAWIAGRLVHADHVIGNTPVYKDDAILLNIYALHRDRKWWDEPERFIPERFSAEEQKKRKGLVYIPFGAGPRMCIGNNFAIMEITMLLAKLFHHFDFELVEGQEVVPEPLITLRPKNGIKMILR